MSCDYESNEFPKVYMAPLPFPEDMEPDEDLGLPLDGLTYQERYSQSLMAGIRHLIAKEDDYDIHDEPEDRHLEFIQNNDPERWARLTHQSRQILASEGYFPELHQPETSMQPAGYAAAPAAKDAEIVPMPRQRTGSRQLSQSA